MSKAQNKSVVQLSDKRPTLEKSDMSDIGSSTSQRCDQPRKEQQKTLPISIADADQSTLLIGDLIGARTVEEVANITISRAMMLAENDPYFDPDDRDFLTGTPLCEQYLDHASWALVAGAVECDHRQDPVLGASSELVSTGAAIPKRSGDVLATALGLALACHPDFTVYREVRIPLADEAFDWLKENPDSDEGTMLIEPDLKSTKVHQADIVVLDRRTGTVWIVESKRGNGPSDAGHTRRLCRNLKASRMCLPKWFGALGIREIKDVRIAVVDHFGQTTVPDAIRAVGGDLDTEFGVRGVDEMMEQLHAIVANETRQSIRPLVVRLAHALGLECHDPKDGSKFLTSAASKNSKIVKAA